MRRRTAWIATAALALLGGLVVWLVATRLFPYHSLNHDEAVYLQQAAMLLDGHLFLRPPVEDALRPWFFVEDGDRLYSKYAPVPAAMFAIGKLLGGYRLALAGIGAGNLALVVGVVREAFDRRTGLLAGVFVLCSPLFLIDSAVFLPYAPTTLLNLTFAYAYLRADRSAEGNGADRNAERNADRSSEAKPDRSVERRWAALAGGAIGLAFFARPYTAVLFAVPFMVHALWTLRGDWRRTLPRQATTAALGLAGVAVALGYNALVTGSPWLFPYQAFAPLDGLGFGHRAILAHDVDYTVDLALRANRRVVDLFFTEWIAGGPLGAILAAVGLGIAVRRGPTARRAVLAGLFASIVVGNVYFWGNLNVLGDLDRAGDGLVAALGPYYHFDLLLPTAAFAACAAVGTIDAVRETAGDRLTLRQSRALCLAVCLVGASALGTVTVGDVEHRFAENREVTRTYETAYEPFEGGPPADSVVLLPTPYGPWLNHPFQYLRNDPGFDGRAVYATGDRPFAVADAFPDRTLYRYAFRGAWAPFDGSPEAARLQRVRDVSGSSVRLDATVGVPDGAVGVTARVATDDGSAYYVADPRNDLDVRLLIADGRVRLAGDVRPSGNGTGTVAVAGRDTVRLTVFVDYGPGGGFTYRFDLPVDAAADEVRALSPRIERCRDVRTCGGAATYVPDAAPDGAFVRSELTARERNP